MAKAIIRHNYLLAGLLAFAEISLLASLLIMYPLFGMSVKTLMIVGLTLTAGWSGGLCLIASRVKTQDVDHLVVDLTHHRSLFASIVFCLACLIIWSVFLIMVLTVAPKEARISRQVNDYFEQIRFDQPLLTAFLTSMPKGADLHHHYSGSVYGETYWEILSDSNGWINMVSLDIDTPNAVHEAPWKHFMELRREKWFDSLKQEFLRKVSIKDYNPSTPPPDQQFSTTFEKMASVASFGMQRGLLELKQRAVSENVQYIETILWQTDTAISPPAGTNWEKSLTAASLKDSLTVFDTLNKIHTALISDGVVSAAKNFCRKLDEVHYRANIDDSSFMIRYLLYVTRSASALSVYRRLLIAFQAASLDTLVVGVHLGGAEEGEVFPRDYSLNILMVAHLSRLYPNVKYTIHAGDLAIGMVRPELLRSQITQAVMIAGAKRLGHGVDIAYESNWKDVLDSMSKQKIPIEVNLSSNEFILEIKNEQHPILLYHTHKVPIVIGTDIAGVLRTDLTQQYVLLATRYPTLHYADIKQIVKNSISYSFIQPAACKEQKIRELDTAFLRFEERVLKYRRDQRNRK